jgi:membrane-bound lytic murein transglycosylase D
LKTLSGAFDGDWHLALASYNAGPGRLQSALRRSKRSSFWDLISNPRLLPRETREYVPMILAAVVIARNPALYGFQVDAAAPLAYETVEIPGALELARLAEWAGITVGDLQDLNPALRRMLTPMAPFALKVPVGTAASIQARLGSVDQSEYRTFKFHVVRRGETLTTIARRYKLTTAQLREANDLRSSRVARNQTLMIPARTTAALPSPPAARASATAASSGATYRVRPGDTLFSIARQFETTVDTLRQLNRLAGDRINIGDRLTVRR